MFLKSSPAHYTQAAECNVLVIWSWTKLWIMRKTRFTQHNGRFVKISAHKSLLCFGEKFDASAQIAERLDDYLKAAYSCRKRNAGFHKARRSCLRGGCVCWLCIPQQRVVFLFVPDQFASFVWLLILHTVSCCFLPPLRRNQVIGNTHPHIWCTAMESKCCWACSAKNKIIKKIHIHGCVFTTHTWTQTCYKQVGFYFYWNTYGLLYSWQLQETYMQSAPATVRLKHAQCIKTKTAGGGKKT